MGLLTLRGSDQRPVRSDRRLLRTLLPRMVATARGVSTVGTRPVSRRRAHAPPFVRRAPVWIGDRGKKPVRQTRTLKIPVVNERAGSGSVVRAAHPGADRIGLRPVRRQGQRAHSVRALEAASRGVAGGHRALGLRVALERVPVPRIESADAPVRRAERRRFTYDGPTSSGDGSRVPRTAFSSSNSVIGLKPAQAAKAAPSAQDSPKHPGPARGPAALPE